MTSSSSVTVRCDARQLKEFSPLSHARIDLPNGGALLSFHLPHPLLELRGDTLVRLDGSPASSCAVCVRQISPFRFEAVGQDAVRVTGSGVARYKLFMAGQRRLVSPTEVEWRVKVTHSVRLTVTDSGLLELRISSPFLEKPEVHRASHPHPLRELMVAWGRVFRDAASTNRDETETSA